MSYQLTLVKDEVELGTVAARLIAQQVQKKPASILALPTGQTPLPMYQALAHMERCGQVSLSGVHTFNLDEFWRLPADHPGSYHAYMQREFFAHVSIPSTHIHLLDGMAADAVAECARYEAAIAALGGLDLAILGIGENGHIGFNEPGSALDSHTRLVTLTPTTRAANAIFFASEEEVPHQALTLGIAAILAARRILLLAGGESKAQALHLALHGPITPDLPASALQRHPHVTILADRDAAGNGF